MATYKQVTLKDPKTGDYLIPRVYGTIGYQVVDGEITPPFDPRLDAYTLQGHPASYFATATELNAVKTSVSEGKALIAAAVTGKGVSTAADATFQQIADNINAIVSASNISLLYKTVSMPNEITTVDVTFDSPVNGYIAYSTPRYYNNEFLNLKIGTSTIRVYQSFAGDYPNIGSGNGACSLSSDKKTLTISCGSGTGRFPANQNVSLYYF